MPISCGEWARKLLQGSFELGGSALESADLGSGRGEVFSERLRLGTQLASSEANDFGLQDRSDVWHEAIVR
jgi:hypothetical protein